MFTTKGASSMRRSTLQSQSNIAGSKRIEQLAAAPSEFRREHGPGGRIAMGLRRQYLAAFDLGGSATAIGRACGVSWTQTRSWGAAAGSRRRDNAGAAGAVGGRPSSTVSVLLIARGRP